MRRQVQERFETLRAFITFPNFSFLIYSVGTPIAHERVWTRSSMSTVSQSRHTEKEPRQAHGKTQTGWSLATLQFQLCKRRNSYLMLFLLKSCYLAM